MINKLYFNQGGSVITSVKEPEPVQRSGSGSTIDKTDEIPNNIRFVSSHIAKMLFKNKYLVRKKELCFNKMLMVESLLFYRSWSRSR